MGASASKILQLTSSGEAAWGTTGAATRKLHGVTDATLKINSDTRVVESQGWYGPSTVVYEGSQSGAGAIEMVLSYDEFPILLNGVFTANDDSTGSSTGGTTGPNNYPYEAPTSSTQAVYSYTIEYGTTAATYRAPGSVISNMTVRGEAGGAWEATFDTVAKQIIASTSGLSSGLSDRTVVPIRMANTTLYVDAFSTGTMGASEVAATLIDFELNVNPNRHLKLFAGSKVPSSFGDGRMEGSLRMTLEFNTTAKALVDELLGTSTGALVKRQIRIGATQGSDSGRYTANLDFAGTKVEGETLFGDRDGNIIIETNWQGTYSTGLTNWFICNVENQSTSTT